jgi:hypothetical protein
MCWDVRGPNAARLCHAYTGSCILGAVEIIAATVRLCCFGGVLSCLSYPLARRLRFDTSNDNGGDCNENAAAKWHSNKVADGYTRFLLIVLSVLKQIRDKDEPVLTDFNESGFDRAFAFFRPSN